MVLRTTFGILRSSDRGRTWDWICESAIGLGAMGQEDPTLGVTGGGAILAALAEGLAVSPDTGCSWSLTSGDLPQQPAIDVTVRPNAPQVALLLTSSPGAMDAGAAPQLFISSDDGSSWAPYGVALDPSLRPTSVEVAASDAHRVYVSGGRGSGAATTASLLVSSDDGQAFVEHPIPIDPTTETSAFIAAVDPTNADRVYVRTGAGDTSRLLVSDDAGASFRPVYQGGPILGFALASDGTTVYLGGPEDGLQKASTSDFRFQQQSPIPVGCIALLGPTVYICVLQPSVLLASSDHGAPFAPALYLRDLRGPLSCPAGPATTTTVCAAQWPALRMAYGIGSSNPVSPDGGPAATPPPPSAPAPPPSTPKGCSCEMGAAQPLPPLGIGLLWGSLLILWRWRR
jgi:hypothetical protein